METRELPLSPEQVIIAEWERVIVPLVSEDKREAAEFFLNATLAQYEEDGRYYHVLLHIANGVKQLEPYRDRKDYTQLFLAYLWHDLIYDTSSQTNEEASAREAVSMMDVLDLPGADTVSRLIIATKSHQAELEDEALICAIDLSVLGADEDSYNFYRFGIYKEYSMYDPEVFRKGRIRVLRNLLGDEDTAIFTHPDFAHLNVPAKHNMEQELVWLEQ